MKVVITYGTRPEIIKLAPVIKELRKRGHETFIVHTGQHYDKNLADDFFSSLDVAPDYKFYSMIEFQDDSLAEYEHLYKKGFTHSIVQGDTNSALYAAEISKKAGMVVSHVEAGIRSFDMSMPEEINRIMIDSISDYLFCPTGRDVMNCRKYGKSYSVGNTVSDSIAMVYDKIQRFNKEYNIITMHRPSNVDSKKTLKKQLNNISKFCEMTEIKDNLLFLHPRTQKNLDKFGLKIPKNIKVKEPISNYTDMLTFINNAKYVITDSGGLQEECAILGTRCVVMRENTERPAAVTCGSSFLVGNDFKKFKWALETFEENKFDKWHNPFGQDVSQKIVDILEGEKK